MSASVPSNPESIDQLDADEPVIVHSNGTANDGPPPIASAELQALIQVLHEHGPGQLLKLFAEEVEERGLDPGGGAAQT